MAGKLIFFIDFDGTISREDVCYTMVKTFAREGWAELNNLWEEGVLSTGDCAQATLDLMDVLPEQLNSFFNQMKIDPAFPSFLEWIEKQNHPIYILSDGYTNYIDLILQREQIDLEYYGNIMEYREGWQVDMPHLNPECGKCGVCKKGKIEELAGPGTIKIYVGDGYSDLCPARHCDIVFAKPILADLCSREEIPFYNFNSFEDILSKLQQIFKADKE
ncbi:MAG: MtnX-like HAD-IB family phosphatase [Syntrophomonas sp.]